MFSTADLTNMRVAQDDHMMDTCKFGTATQTADSHGQLIETFAYGADVICGLDMRPGSERHGTDKTVVNYDATIRLPIAYAPDSIDRVRVTKRHGEALGVALTYNIVGPVQRGPSGVRLLLKIIET